jgi:iron(III) transport system permease protein
MVDLRRITKGRKIGLGHFFMGVPALLLLLFVAFPISLIFFQSVLSEAGTLTVEFLERIFEVKSNYMSLMNTLSISLLTVFFTILIGCPLAWVVTRTDMPCKGLFKTLFIIPYMIPPFIGAIAWGLLLSPRTGFVNKFLMALFNTSNPPFNIYTYGGVVFVMSIYFYPYVFITVTGALERMDPSLEEAARSSGSGRFRVVRDITLPLVAPSIAAGALLVFIAACSNFGIPALIGSEGRVYVLTTRIFFYIYSGGFEGLQMASSLSIFLVITSALALVANRWYLRKKQFTIIAGKSMRPNVVLLGKYRVPFFIGCCFFTFATMLAPLLCVVLISLLKAYGVEITWKNFTLANYKFILFEYELTRVSIWNSIRLSLTAATFLTVIGSLIAYIIVRTNLTGRRILEFLSTLPYSIPGTVLAIGMILAFSGKFGINLYNTIWILLVAYTARYMAFAVKSVGASLEQVHMSLEEAARVSGAGWGKTFKDIVVPLVKPGLIAAWFLAFMPMLRELTTSVLLYGPETRTIGVAVYELQDGGYYDTAAALATLVIIVIFAGNFLMKKITGGEFGF